MVPGARRDLVTILSLDEHDNEMITDRSHPRRRQLLMGSEVNGERGEGARWIRVKARKVGVAVRNEGIVAMKAG